jgi:hypothetical protein
MKIHRKSHTWEPLIVCVQMNSELRKLTRSRIRNAETNHANNTQLFFIVFVADLKKSRLFHQIMPETSTKNVIQEFRLCFHQLRGSVLFYLLLPTIPMQPKVFSWT